MEKSLWEKSIEFHGHECPGLAIGFRACEIAEEFFELDFYEQDEMVCISEIETCPVDAIRFVAGCNEEKGNLIINKTGNPAFSFRDNESGRSVRLVFKGVEESLSKEEKKNLILNAPKEEIFWIQEII
ncbi:formylmethanofuran dehydrogenase subunit E family protein [Alkalibacter mobilis]|uniref:formylmethanofuran dehydrogenase subunit E family protein n=1 Tax=Alkalibacter mobilis TaxID=2787712 RepID=UPI00189D944B|nr:formylmethanofuran dehydrogenase subunit E family protein [Alkalibacter mobilis]MBF7097435.1 formylmethanofuran dehydrogenase subunit E family protein [Alkalibacter mobilis]